MDHSLKIWQLDKDCIQSAMLRSYTYSGSKTNKPFPTYGQNYPDFSTRDIHRNYVDCVRWLGKFVLSKVLRILSFTIINGKHISNCSFKHFSLTNFNFSLSLKRLSWFMERRKNGELEILSKRSDNTRYIVYSDYEYLNFSILVSAWVCQVSLAYETCGRVETLSTVSYLTPGLLPVSRVGESRP